MGLDDLLDDGTDLARRMRPFYVRLLESAWSDAEFAGLVVGAFSLDNPFIKAELDKIAKRITGIAEVSREQVREVEAQATAEGWTVADRATRYQEIFEGWTTSRAQTIARTESADSFERGNHAAWRASGEVDRKEWLLGPSPCPECQSLGGMVVGIDDEFAPGVEHPPYHPMCTCATAPVIRDLD